LRSSSACCLMAALGSSVAWMRSRSTATSMVTVGLRAVRAVLLISISRVGERWRPVRCGRRWGCGRLQWCPGPLVGAAGRIRGKDEERARPAIWWFTVHPLRFASSLCRSGGVQCVGCRKCSCRKVVSAESSYRLGSSPSPQPWIVHSAVAEGMCLLSAQTSGQQLSA
jgi:hypothetical protein